MIRSCRAFLVAFLAVLVAGTPAMAQKRKISFIRDAETEEAIRTMAAPIFEAAGIDSNSVSISLIQDSSLNAFVAGGMNMYIHTGLLQAADDAGELVGVMAHETGHIAGGHLIRSKDAIENASAQAILALLLGVATGFASGDTRAGAAVMAGGQELARRAFFSFSRTQESSADQAGLSYLDHAGFSAEGLLRFMEKLGDQELLPEDRQVEFVRTHPLTRDRIDALRHHVETSPLTGKPFPEKYDRMFERIRAKLQGWTYPRVALQKYKTSDTAIPARYGRAVALYRTGHADEALALLQGLLKDEPQNPFFHELKGQILFENGRVKEAIAPYRLAVKYQPSSALLRTAIGHVLVESGDKTLRDEAVRNLQESTRLERRNPFTWRLLATVWGQEKQEGLTAYALAEEALARGKIPEAKARAERAEKLLPAGSPAWIRIQDIRAVVDTKDTKKDDD
ncbi:MAG: M48 family metalloprotease [Pseudomonadota bacterium]|nr:M48 family metalloprotease [Pseudomonadota bacterium]